MIQQNTITKYPPFCTADVHQQLMALVANNDLRGLDENEIYGAILAAAITTENAPLANNVEHFVKEHVDEETVANAKFAAAFVDMQRYHKNLLHSGNEIIVQKDRGDYRPDHRNPKMKVVEKHNKGDCDFLLFFLAALYIKNAEYSINLYDELLVEKRVNQIAVNTAILIATTIDTIAKVRGNTNEQNIKALIVDDNLAMLRILKATLEETGKFDVITANNGVDALKLGKLYKPDLVIMDILMPGMEGNVVVERLNKDADLKNTKFIFFSALFSKNETEDTGKIIGGNMCLAKPVKGDDILYCVEKTLKQ